MDKLSIPGREMMKQVEQSDEIIHSYTVGKALEDVIFDGNGKATEVYGYIYSG